MSKYHVIGKSLLGLMLGFSAIAVGPSLFGIESELTTHSVCLQPIDFDGSCFIKFDGIERSFCEAYWLGQSCFIAFDSGSDRGWCEVLNENKSCFIALSGDDRKRCELRRFPVQHVIWKACAPQ